jgi:predicted nucleic acid-binding Zn ribbon protein
MSKKEEEYNKNPKLCECCGKPIPWEKRQNKYCSHSCAAKITNIGVSRNKVITDRFCVNCGKPLDSNHKKYCSKGCQIEVEQTQYIQRWKEGLESGSKGASGVSTIVRRYLMTLYDNKCQLCGWGQINQYTNSIPLAIHHINGDCTDNSFDNLQLLCPNCHSLTDNFGSLNKESKRFHRQKVTKEKDKKL